jgi:hypothetical protein
MKLTKEEIALLDKDPKVFLIRAYKLHYPDMSVREVAKRVGLSHTKVHQVFTAGFTAGFTAKPLQIKGKREESFTPEFTAGFTANVTLTSLLKPLFEASFMERSGGMAFVWSAKEMAGLKGLGKQIAFSLKSKGRPNDDNSVANAFPAFLDSIHDTWILGHFSPSIINSKYNEIIASYNQRQRTPSPTDAKQRATDALEALRAGALSVRQQG